MSALLLALARGLEATPPSEEYIAECERIVAAQDPTWAGADLHEAAEDLIAEVMREREAPRCGGDLLRVVEAWAEEWSLGG